MSRSRMKTTVVTLAAWFSCSLIACATDIELGRKLKVREDPWLSSGETFAVGFTPATTSGMYTLAVWYNSVQFTPKTVIWTAMTLDDHDQPLLVSENAELLLTNDALIVTEGTLTVWQTVIISCDQCISSARVSESGNFVMLNSKGETLWESFSSPTDTILPNQHLLGARLLSAGDYTLQMNAIQVILRYKHYPTQPYWSITNNNLTSVPEDDLNILPKLDFSSNGMISFYDGRGKSWNNSLGDSSQRYAVDYGNTEVMRRLTLERTGSLVMYSLANDNSSWNAVWKSNMLECEIFGVCGAFGLCSYKPHASCTCPPGFHRVKEDDPSEGCVRNVPMKCDHSTNKFVRLIRTDYPWNDYNFNAKIIMSMEECKLSCLRDCDCLAAAYKFQGTDLCFHKGKAGKLYNGLQTAFHDNIVFLKVSGDEGAATDEDLPIDDAFETDVSVSWESDARRQTERKDGRNRRIFFILLGVAAAEAMLLVSLAAVWWLLKRREETDHRPSKQVDEWKFLVPV